MLDYIKISFKFSFIEKTIYYRPNYKEQTSPPNFKAEKLITFN